MSGTLKGWWSKRSGLFPSKRWIYKYYIIREYKYDNDWSVRQKLEGKPKARRASVVCCKYGRERRKWNKYRFINNYEQFILIMLNYPRTQRQQVNWQGLVSCLRHPSMTMWSHLDTTIFESIAFNKDDNRELKHVLGSDLILPSSPLAPESQLLPVQLSWFIRY